MTFGRLTLIWAFILCNIIVNTSAQTNKGQGIVFVVEIGTNHSVGPNVVERTVEVLETRLKAIGAQYEVLRSRENNNQVLVKVHSTNDFAKFRGLFQNHSLEIRAVVSPPNPRPYQYFTNFSEAQAKCKGSQVVGQYNVRDGEASQFVILEGETIVNGLNIKRAEAISRTGFEGDYQIHFFLTKDGSLLLSEWSGKNINNYIVLILDDTVINVAFVKSQLFDEGEISGRMTRLEAETIASALQSGNLPAGVKIISESQFK